MRKLLLAAMVMIAVTALCACGSKNKTINDILGLPAENPVSIEVRYDDPALRSVLIYDEDAIESGMSALKERTCIMWKAAQLLSIRMIHYMRRSLRSL